MSRRIVAEFDAVTGPFLQKMDRIDRSIGQFERNAMTGIGRVERGINGLANSASRLRNITGLIATGFGANLATQFLDKAALIRNALREAGDTSQETFEEVFRSSVRALAGFDNTAAGVQRFHKALRDNQDVRQTIRDVETLNKLLALGGKTTQERASTFIQFSQALQAGYLGGEELRAVRENAPLELVEAIAREAGGTIEDLKDLGAAGELTRDVMVRALRSLEKEADERFGAIRVTIQDAAQVFRSGAIIAAEGFDEGLGLSRVTVTTLKNVGQILGENGEAARMFGEAVKVAGAFMLTSFAGRRITNVTEALADQKRELYANAAAMEANVAKTAKANAAARARVASTEAAVNALRAKGASEAAVAAAMARHERAVRRATQATQQHTGAVIAADAAQKRLLLSTRLTAGAMGLLRGAVGFLGGIPGIILTAVTAFYLLRDSAESAEERMQRLTESSGELKTVTTELETLQQSLVDLAKARADAEENATDRIIATTKREYEAKRNLARLTLTEAQQVQAERVRELLTLQDRLANVASVDERFRRETFNERTGGQTYVRPALEAEMRQRMQLEADEERRNIQNQIIRLEAAIAEGRSAIEETRQVLATDFPEAVREALQPNGLDDLIGSIGDAAAKGMLDLIGAAEGTDKGDGYNETLGYGAFTGGDVNLVNMTLREVLELQRRMLAHPDNTFNSSAVGRYQIVSRTLRSLIEELGLSLEEQFTPDLQDRMAEHLIRRRRGQGLEGLRNEWEGLRYVTDANIVKAMGQQVIPVTDEGVARAQKEAEEERAETLKRQNEEALGYIEDVMTKQELHTKQIREMIELRQQLAATYGDEADIVKQLDVAIQRVKESYETVSEETKKLFGIISDNIASSVEEWKGWGDLVKNILADIVRAEGVNFFISLLTPGAQKGSSLGTRLGNAVTGNGFAEVLHEGGQRGPARRVNPMTFLGAPRYHDGLFPGEFRAILERGETVLPKGASISSGSTANFYNSYDFRGADKGVEERVKAMLDERDRTFQSRWLRSQKEAKASRMIG